MSTDTLKAYIAELRAASLQPHPPTREAQTAVRRAAHQLAELCKLVSGATRRSTRLACGAGRPVRRRAPARGGGRFVCSVWFGYRR